MPHPPPAQPPSFAPGQIVRPDPTLWRYYIVIALLTGPAFPFTLVALYFQYATLRYRFDEHEDGGVWMAKGILFKKEVNLTYRRIQDIHVSRNIIQRWFGLANVAVQTASGSSTPEMTVEGVMDADALRDFLYHHMRGAKGQASPAAPVGAEHGGSVAPSGSGGSTNDGEALVLLREIRDSLDSLRDQLRGRAS